MPERPVRGIVLAAGMGTRLRAVSGVPKGLLEIDGQTLVGRSVALLRSAGVERITLVAGYGQEHYRRFAERTPGVQIVVNDQYATTGSMASLAAALEVVHAPTLVLESDIVYERRAIESLLDSAAADATLVSGPTAAGDEVWVDAPGGRLRAMSKEPGTLAGVDGEFVGITRLSAAGAAAMETAFEDFVAAHGHARMDYETDALVTIARARPVAVVVIPDLCWGEIDDEHHLERVRRDVWPRLAALDSQRLGGRQ